MMGGCSIIALKTDTKIFYLVSTAYIIFSMITSGMNGVIITLVTGDDACRGSYPVNRSIFLQAHCPRCAPLIKLAFVAAGSYLV